MADHGTVEYATATGNDYPAHVQSYERFVEITFVGIIFVINILFGLAIGGVMGHWLMSIPVFILAVVGIVPGLVSGTRTSSTVAFVLCFADLRLRGLVRVLRYADRGQQEGRMRIAVARETDGTEPRVAATPETVKKFIALGAEVAVARGAGSGSGISDADFEAVGAKVGDDVTKDADVVLKVRRPGAAELKDYKKGALVIAIMDPYGNEPAVKQMADAGVVAFAMELMPRITRAQSMDVLSSQANLAGYRAVIDAAEEYGRALPMMMTAAGTVPAAKVFIMGVGVAGLQAIATAKRLGAIVTATDVRPATKEQVESLGAKFLAVEDEEFKNAQTAGGYAKEMSKEYQAKQAALTAEHIKKQDIVITTALIPGRPAPRLISKEMVASMRDGSVIVDLAVERGGNVEGARPGEIAKVGGVKIVGYLNVRGPHRGVGVRALRQEFAHLRRHDDRQEREKARGQLGRRTDQGHRAHPRRRHRAPDVQAENGGLTENRHVRISRNRRRPLRVPPVDLRARRVRRLLRGLVGDAGAAHAADVGDQRHLLGDRGRRAARRRRRPGRRRQRHHRWRARSASSR